MNKFDDYANTYDDWANNSIDLADTLNKSSSNLWIPNPSLIIIIHGFIGHL
jgi:hypothetical protein